MLSCKFDCALLSQVVIFSCHGFILCRIFVLFLSCQIFFMQICDIYLSASMFLHPLVCGRNYLVQIIVFIYLMKTVPLSASGNFF